MRVSAVRVVLLCVATPILTACLDLPDFSNAASSDGGPGGPSSGDAGGGVNLGDASGATNLDAGATGPSPVHSASGYTIVDLKARSGSLFWTEVGPQDARAMRCTLPACAAAVPVASSAKIYGTAVSADTEFVIHDAPTGDVAVTAYGFDGTAGAMLLRLYGITGPADVDDAGFVYFSFPTQKTGGILELGKREQSCDGCVQAYVVTPTDPQVSMQIANETAWWTTSARLVRCPTGGAQTGSQTTTTLLQGKTNLGGLAVGGGTIYWADTAAGTITACSAQLDDCSTAAPIATAQVAPLRVAVDADRVSWVNAGTGANDGSVMTCAAPGCAGGARPLATNQANPSEIATDGSSVFWTAGSTLYRVPK